MSGKELHEIFWFITSSGLIIYCLLSLVIYLQSKIKLFLYYGFYSFLLLLYVSTKVPPDFVLYKWVYAYYQMPFSFGTQMYIQIIYNCLLAIFYTEFLDFKSYFPRFNQVLKRLFLILLVTGALFFIWSITTGRKMELYYFFIYGFIPVISVFTIYWIYIALKIPGKLKYFMIFGVIVYNGFAYIAFFKTTQGKFFQGDFPPIIYFFIGIILESLIFATGLGYKVKVLYLEKIKAQEKIIQNQKENQVLKEKHNKELEKRLKKREEELRKSLNREEKEKIKAVTLAYEKELYTLRLESLQSQMNPHFIFNALNSIKVYLVRNDKKKAAYYLNLFAKLIRKILESSHKDSVSLREELETLQLYMNIENMRFEQEIFFSIENPDNISLDTIMLPGLILQPFVENALWHGLATKKEEKRLILYILKKNNGILLQIEDNGIGRDKAKIIAGKKSIQKESLGLILVQERLLVFNKKHDTNHSFSITDLFDNKGNAKGTRVKFYFIDKQHQ